MNDEWGPLETLARRAPAPDDALVERVLAQGRRARSRRRTTWGAGVAAAAVVVAAVAVLAPAAERPGPAPGPAPATSDPTTAEPTPEPTPEPALESVLGEPHMVAQAVRMAVRGEPERVLEILDVTCRTDGGPVGERRDCVPLTDADRDALTATLSARTVRFVPGDGSAMEPADADPDTLGVFIALPRTLDDDRLRVYVETLRLGLGSAGATYEVRDIDPPGGFLILPVGSQWVS